MTDLFTNPRSKAEDIGKPIPDEVHATSVCMPLWEHNVAYEEAVPEILDQFKSGYPRFFSHPACQQ